MFWNRMMVLTNYCMHQKHWQPPQRGIKSLNRRERVGNCREAGRVLQSWCGEPKVEDRGATRQEGALAELDIANDVQQLFAATSIAPCFSLEF